MGIKQSIMDLVKAKIGVGRKPSTAPPAVESKWYVEFELSAILVDATTQKEAIDKARKQIIKVDPPWCHKNMEKEVMCKKLEAGQSIGRIKHEI